MNEKFEEKSGGHGPCFFAVARFAFYDFPFVRFKKRAKFPGFHWNIHIGFGIVAFP